MNRKQFLILVVALLVLGGAGIALFWKDIEAYRDTGAKIGAKLLPSLKVADVAQVRLQDAKDTVTLVKKENAWVVQERAGYAADIPAIADLLVKLVELKVTQAEQVGTSLLPRIDLVEPGKGEGAGTLVEFKDSAGKPLARLVLGKKVLKKDPLNPLPAAKDGVPAARYVLRLDSQDTVVVVSDPLNSAEAKPGKWLAKDFFKAERIKALGLADEGEAAKWKIARDVEWGQWKFAAGNGELDASAAVGAVNSLANISFTDVAIGAKAEDVEKSSVVVAETFDALTYTIRLAKKKGGDDYHLTVGISGEPPAARTPEKDEKAEERERRDKDFVETRKRLEERLAREKALAKWTYVVARSAVEPLFKEREQMVAQKKKGDPRK
jgi:hypothetical protein